MENSPEQTQNVTPPVQNQNSKKWIIIAAVVIVASFFFKTAFSPENIAEKAIERASDGQYNVDIDKDGSMQVTGGDGEQVNITTGKEASLPDNWPSSIPVLSDAKIEYSGAFNVGDDGSTFTVTYATSLGEREVINYYKDELVKNGWAIQGTMETGEGSILTVNNENDEAVVINVGTSEEGTSVAISAQIAK